MLKNGKCKASRIRFSEKSKTAITVNGNNFTFSWASIATLQGTLDEDGKPVSLAEQDMIAIKATMRIGYLVVKDDAFAAVAANTNF